MTNLASLAPPTLGGRHGLLPLVPDVSSEYPRTPDPGPSPDDDLNARLLARRLERLEVRRRAQAASAWPLYHLFDPEGPSFPDAGEFVPVEHHDELMVSYTRRHFGRPDTVASLRELYARGDITVEEFEERLVSSGALERSEARDLAEDEQEGALLDAIGRLFDRLQLGPEFVWFVVLALAITVAALLGWFS